MVTRAGALARLSIDPRRLDALCDGIAGEHEIDPHPEVLVEHPGPVVPVREHALGRPVISHDVVQTDPLEVGERGPFRRGDMGLADVRPGVEHVLIGGRNVHVAAHDGVGGVAGDRVAQRGEPLQLVAVMIGVGRPPVGDVHGDDADPAAHRRHGTGLGIGKPGSAVEPVDDVL